MRQGRRQQVSTSLRRDGWQWQPVCSWGSYRRLYSCLLIYKASVSWMPLSHHEVISMCFKAAWVHCCGEEGEYGGAALRVWPSEWNPAWWQLVGSYGGLGVSAEPAFWSLFHVYSLRIPHLSFILPKAPCTSHCQQPPSYTSGPVGPQSWICDSSSCCQLVVSTASFAFTQGTEMYQTHIPVGIQ